MNNKNKKQEEKSEKIKKDEKLVNKAKEKLKNKSQEEIEKIGKKERSITIFLFILSITGIIVSAGLYTFFLYKKKYGLSLFVLIALLFLSIYLLIKESKKIKNNKTFEDWAIDSEIDKIIRKKRGNNITEEIKSVIILDSYTVATDKLHPLLNW